MDRLDELKAKYQPVLQVISELGVRLDDTHVQDNKLFLQGTAPSKFVKNLVWNQIKTVDPTYADLICKVAIESRPLRRFTAITPQTDEVISGNSFSKFARRSHRRGDLFKRIIDALRIPAA